MMQERDDKWIWGDMMVWTILITLFLAVGIHLTIYSNRRRRMLKNFSQKKGLQYLPEDRSGLENELNRRLAIEGSGISRSFMKIKDIVRDGEFFLFRCTELLDLNPCGSSETTHQNHICLSFDVPLEMDLFFIVDREGKQRNLHPKHKLIEEDKYFKKIKNIIQNHLHRNSVTISFRGGRALLYTNPLVTGGEKEEDLEYLMLMGRTIRNKLINI